MNLNSIEEAIHEIKLGRVVIVVDDEERENEGDLVMAAEKVTPASINFMAQHGRGLICVPLTGERLKQLHLPLMVNENTSPFETAFTVSVDARQGVTTGISANDRAKTIHALIDPQTQPEALAKPGHIFPLMAKEGGVLVRAGQTEAAVDLARLAGLNSSGVICEIMNEDGSMARLPQLLKFSKNHHLKIISIADLIQFRRKKEKLVKLVASPRLPSKYGQFQLYAYEDIINGSIHIGIVKGKIKADRPVLVRVHSECLTGDVLGSERCDCGKQLEAAMKMISQKGGVLLYLRQEGRGIGLLNKMRAYELQEKGLDTVEANQKLGFKPDQRDYGIGAQILADLGIRKMNLITNNPRKHFGLSGYGLQIVKIIPLRIQANKSNRNYLETKKEKLGHYL